MNIATAQKLQAACVTINQTAIEFLAAKYRVRPSTILDQISLGNASVISQFKALTEAGMRAAVQMDAEGKISLTSH
jgi:hypothetical protein